MTDHLRDPALKPENATRSVGGRLMEKGGDGLWRWQDTGDVVRCGRTVIKQGGRRKVPCILPSGHEGACQ